MKFAIETRLTKQNGLFALFGYPVADSKTSEHSCSAIAETWIDVFEDKEKALVFAEDIMSNNDLENVSLFEQGYCRKD